MVVKEILIVKPKKWPLWTSAYSSRQIWSFRDLPSLSGASNPAFDSIFLFKK